MRSTLLSACSLRPTEAHERADTSPIHADTLRRPESEYLLLLVTHYHGVWIIVAAFNEAPAITGVIADLRTVASIANLESQATCVAVGRVIPTGIPYSGKHQVESYVPQRVSLAKSIAFSLLGVSAKRIDLRGGCCLILPKSFSAGTFGELVDAVGSCVHGRVRLRSDWLVKGERVRLVRFRGV